MSGPLAGVKIIELVGIGPGPFAGMLLADMGAEVIAVDRMGRGSASPTLPVDLARRGKRAIAVDLKQPQGRAIVQDLIRNSDGFFEGYRPGVTEKLGVGPDDLLAINPRLVYGRLTGWGQDGPLAQAAGHDINYIALSGALHAMGPKDAPPVPPLNLVGDYAGGSLMMAFGLMAGILNARTTGKGQVVDVSMVEGASLLMTLFHSLKASGLWAEARGVNMLDGGAHFYGTFETADGRHVSLGAIEPPFMQLFIDKAGLNPDWLSAHMDTARWPELRTELAAVFKTKTQADWCTLLEGTDACFAPVLPFWEAADHPHNAARGSFTEVDGVTQPAPAPKFSETPGVISRGPVKPGGDTDAILTDLGRSEAEIASLRESGTVA